MQDGEEAYNDFSADHVFTGVQVLGNGDVPGRVILPQFVGRPVTRVLMAVDKPKLGKLDELQICGVDLAMASVSVSQTVCTLEYLQRCKGHCRQQCSR